VSNSKKIDNLLMMGYPGYPAVVRISHNIMLIFKLFYRLDNRDIRFLACACTRARTRVYVREIGYPGYPVMNLL